MENSNKLREIISAMIDDGVSPTELESEIAGIIEENKTDVKDFYDYASSHLIGKYILIKDQLSMTLIHVKSVKEHGFQDSVILNGIAFLMSDTIGAQSISYREDSIVLYRGTHYEIVENPIDVIKNEIALFQSNAIEDVVDMADIMRDRPVFDENGNIKIN